MRLPHFHFKETTFSAVSMVIIGAAILMIIGGVAYYAQQEKQRAAITAQTSSTDKLINEVKTLSEQNKKLNEQNRDYAYCNAVLLAKFTQDNQPIVIEDLNKCIFKAFDGTAQPSAEVQTNAQMFLAPQSTQPVQQQSQQTVQPAQTQQTAPQQVTQNPQTPQNPQTQQPTTQQPVIALPKVFNLPCVDLGAVSTCK